MFVFVEDSCHPTDECAPDRLANRVKAGQNTWCGAVKEHKQRKVTSVVSMGSAQEVVLNPAQLKVKAPFGSKMFVCGIDFLRMWKAFYSVSPTSWTVDYHNHVLVASGLLEVQSPFVATQYYPHYSQRKREWLNGDENPNLVPLVDAPLRTVPVVVTALYDYKAEGGGYMHVNRGDRIQLHRSRLQPGDMHDAYSTYAYGYRLGHYDDHHLVERGWFPIDILYDVQTQLEIVGARFV